MANVLSEQEIIEFVHSVGFEYIKRFRDQNKLFVTVICPNKHTNDVIYNNFKTKKGSCKDCKKEKLSEQKRLPLNKVVDYFQKYNFKIINGLESYKNNTSIFTIVCENGHKKETSYANFRVIEEKCNACARGFELTIENIKAKFDERNYDLLEEEFINAVTPMKYICRLHPDRTRKIHWNNFKNGKGCRDCSTEKNTNSRRTTFGKIIKDFENKNYTLVSKSYKNNNDYLIYICNSHPEYGEQKVLYLNLHKTKHNCKECIKEEYRGQNSANWHGGIATITEYLRKKIDKWKQDSMESCNYRCVITGEYFNVIHHLYSFSKIVEETMSSLLLDIRRKIGDYTKEELSNIEKTCLDLHYKYGFGVCLTNKIHDLFHDKYGKYDNTEEQFEEFKVKYKNGDFKEVS